MPTMDDAVAAITALPEVTEGVRWGRRSWFVGGTSFAAERPLSKADLKRLGDAPAPAGPILSVAVDDLGEKEAVLAAGTPGVFTIEHFKDYPAVLISLPVVPLPALRELVEDAWLCTAPPALAEVYRAS
jgi:hypothetical protein